MLQNLYPHLLGFHGLFRWIVLAAAVLIAHAANRHSEMTIWGAQLYFWGRLIYLPLYAFGIPYVRTLAWFVATLGIVLILCALV